MLEFGASILGREEEDWVDLLFAVFNDSHNADGVGHLHLCTFSVPTARGVKYANDILTVFNHDLLAVPSDRMTGLSTHNVFKDRVVLYLVRVCLNMVANLNHFSTSQELDGSGLAYSGLAQRHDERGDLLEVRELIVRGSQEEEELLEVELG